MNQQKPREYIPYIVPFVSFLGLTFIASRFQHGQYILYPFKTIIVSVMLLVYRKHYTEIKLNFSAVAILVGVFVFAIWILPEGMYPKLGESEFNPFKYGHSTLAFLLISFRIIGAVIVVPIMEELFWRSFLIRYLIDSDFKRVPLGKFSWLSFSATVVLFGFEHNRWLVGLIAGGIYNGLLYYKKRLSPCILSHAVTNLALGIYVLYTQKWSFW